MVATLNQGHPAEAKYLAVAVVLIGVVVTASGAKEQTCQGKQHDAGEQHGAEIEPRKSLIHGLKRDALSMTGSAACCRLSETIRRKFAAGTRHLEPVP